MRDIKFRAWDGTKMHYNVVPWQWDFVIDTMSSKCIESNGPGILGAGGSRAMFEVPGIGFKEIMQYTGLKDRNGKEIYEGDLLKSFSPFASHVGPSPVTFENGTFMWKDEPLGYDLQDEDDYLCLPERWAIVVGNIYEKEVVEGRNEGGQQE